MHAKEKPDAFYYIKLKNACLPKGITKAIESLVKLREKNCSQTNESPSIGSQSTQGIPLDLRETHCQLIFEMDKRNRHTLYWRMSLYGSLCITK